MFVACLSEAGDLLSQWRGYCSAGNGFSIGFSQERLLSVLSGQGFGIAACIYDYKEQHSLSEELVDDAIEAIERSVSREDALGTFITRFLRIGPLLKHPSFSEEKEWRILCGIIPTDDARFQVRGRRGREHSTRSIPERSVIQRKARTARTRFLIARLLSV